MSSETFAVYAEHIERLRDPYVGKQAVDDLIESEQRRPPIASVVEAYKTARRRPGVYKELEGAKIEGECAYCDGTGFVEVGVKEVKQIGGRDFTYERPSAPCPHCSRGTTIEFSGQWGESGYWQGREAEKAELVPRRTDVALPIEENARRARELLERLAGVGREMPE